MTYPVFKTVAAAKKAFSRVRTVKTFILKDFKRAPVCACCGKPIDDFSAKDANGDDFHPLGYRNNRCDYDPRTKTVKAMHYLCAWGKTMTQVEDRIATALGN